MKNNNESQNNQINISFKPSESASNKQVDKSIDSTFIRDQMVRPNTYKDSGFSITSSNKQSNSSSFSIDYVRKKMALG